MAKAGVSERVVVLVRHGEVENPSDVRYGRLPGFRLSPSARAQITHTAAWLAARTPRVASVWSSPLERAVETAEALEAVLGTARAITTDARLTELASWLEGLPRTLTARAVGSRLLKRNAYENEPWGDVARRMLAVIDAAARSVSEGSVVMVSHQRPIQIARLALSHAVGTREASLRARVAPWTLPLAACDHASATVLVHRAGRWIVTEYYAPEDEPARAPRSAGR